MSQWERVQDQNAGLSVHWRKASGDVEFRIFHEEDHVVLVARKIRRGQVPEYLYWRSYSSDDAAKFDAEDVASFI